jgi:NAD+ kinase
MKVAIYGQYYQNSTEPIINDICFFLLKNELEMIIEAVFINA